MTDFADNRSEGLGCQAFFKGPLGFFFIAAPHQYKPCRVDTRSNKAWSIWQAILTGQMVQGDPQ